MSNIPEKISIKDIYHIFSTEEKCINLLEEIRWKATPKRTREGCNSTSVKRHKTQSHL